MIHTTTEERTFEGACNHPHLSTATATSLTRLERAASKEGFEHQVKETFRMQIVRADREGEQRYLATVEAVYAKIVPAEQEGTPDEPAAGVIDSVPANLPADADDPFGF